MEDVRVGYLVLIWAPRPHSGAPFPVPNPLTPAALDGARAWGAELAVARLNWASLSFQGWKRFRGERRPPPPTKTPEQFRWLFRFQDGRRNDRKARRIVDSLDGVFCLVRGLSSSDPITMCRVREKHIHKDGMIRVATLMRNPEYRESGLTPEEEPGERLLEVLRSEIHVPAETTGQIWRLFPACQNDRIFRAVTFLRSSYDQVQFWPGKILDFLHEESEFPRTAVQAARIESAFLSAYKAVEAIIGDPNKDARKFHAQLRGAGLDPEDKIGIGHKVRLAQKIRAANDARNKRAGHGSTPRKRLITQGELLELQVCARHVIYRAAEHLLALSKIGKADEVKASQGI